MVVKVVIIGDTKIDIARRTFIEEGLVWDLSNNLTDLENSE
jgi:hypothetical protein